MTFPELSMVFVTCQALSQHCPSECPCILINILGLKYGVLPYPCPTLALPLPYPCPTLVLPLPYPHPCPWASCRSQKVHSLTLTLARSNRSRSAWAKASGDCDQGTDMLGSMSPVALFQKSASASIISKSSNAMWSTVSSGRQRLSLAGPESAAEDSRVTGTGPTRPGAVPQSSTRGPSPTDR